MRLPTYQELMRFVQVEEWEDSNHHRFVFTTPTGERLYTRISHGKGQINNPDLFQHILRDQLGIDESQFWAAVDRGEKPARAPHALIQTSGALDAKLVRNLITKVKVSPNELVGMNEQVAISLWQEWLTTNVPQAEDK